MSIWIGLCVVSIWHQHIQCQGRENDTNQDDTNREERIHSGSGSSSRWDKTSSHNHLQGAWGGGVIGERVRRSLCVPSNVWLQNSTNGWMTATEYQNWLLYVYWKRRERRLLVVDCYKPHKAEESMKMARALQRRCNCPWGVHLNHPTNRQVHQQTVHGEQATELARMDAARSSKD
ncbi:MAG: hypothetical protein MJE68_22370 [Proteobacteria bacterium]|nr:hypothetical protein [Pseudomonadota bacterium]